ncbi:hypothetical protein [Limosilactobacillus caecicola]|uniref:hypothetical protein n=1 Tax=Limosilactobacillus caecicola TaxID=2941332 RepID=UPI00203D9E62|nr:hypothetical protein [Limosilactobacillus caecicola]
MSKSNQELAVELTIAMLEHNASVKNHSEDPTVKKLTSAVAVGQNYKYILGVLDNEIDPFQTKKG